MAISRNRSFIFIKINKTGGTSIQHHLGKLVDDLDKDGHRTIADYDVPLDDFYKFSFVRNPWDKMVSFYAYHAGLDFRLLPTRRRYLFFGRPVRPRPSFREFILEDMHRMEFKNPRGRSSMGLRTSNQLDWLCDNEGRMVMDFVGRFERLQNDCNKICQHLNLAHVSLRKINPSRRNSYAGYYDDETREAVRGRFAKDIEHFGYSFAGDNDSS